MPKIWEYQGFIVDEGLKPHDLVYKPDFYQYFFIIKEGGERKFKYCIWAEKALINDLPEVKEFISKGGNVQEYLRDKALARVKEKIDRNDFSNSLLKIDSSGENEIPLDEQSEKLI